MGKNQYGQRYAALLTLVRSKTSVRANDVSRHLGIDLDNATGLLGRALRRGHVERIDRGQYRATATE